MFALASLLSHSPCGRWSRLGIVATYSRDEIVQLGLVQGVKLGLAHLDGPIVDVNRKHRTRLRYTTLEAAVFRPRSRLIRYIFEPPYPGHCFEEPVDFNANSSGHAGLRGQERSRSHNHSRILP
jgi:hypothetical protein